MSFKCLLQLRTVWIIFVPGPHWLPVLLMAALHKGRLLSLPLLVQLIVSITIITTIFTTSFTIIQVEAKTLGSLPASCDFSHPLYQCDI